MTVKMPKTIVIAGTSDAREVIGKMVGEGISVIATVTTDYGERLLRDIAGLKVLKGKLGKEEMIGLIKDKAADFVIDGSHPFAKEASLNAIDACKECRIPYIRFERSNTDVNEGSVLLAEDFKEAARMAADFEGNIFLAIGSNNMGVFADRVPGFTKRVFARILPDSKMIEKCQALGLSPGNIIAIKGPFSVELNMEMFKHCKASLIISKESGNTGGTDKKLEAGKRLGIPVIMVVRPQIDYGIKVSSADAVLELIRSQCP